MSEPIDPDKYIVFKREEFEPWLYKVNPLPEDGSPVPQALRDAVVIRRQDFFAGPALHSYAASISLASRLTDDDVKRTHLQDVADYFSQQAVLSDEEAWKLPD